MPALRLIHSLGAGLDNIDVVEATRRNIAVSCGSGTNASSVADHAMALVLALLRGIPSADADVRAGRWSAVERPLLTGKRVGIVGLGEIGRAFAKRALGFDTTIAYHNRKPREDVPYRYCASPSGLADVSDILLVAVPASATTLHLVNAEVLAYLGPQGYLANVGRGSAVDTLALAGALRSGGVAGAALDVFEGEPHLPRELQDAPNLIVTPHMAGLSAEALSAAHMRAIENFGAFFSGQKILGRIN